MNEEIKKLIDKFKPELKGNGDDTEYEMGWNDACLEYEIDFDNALNEAYKQGAKDMREAVKVEYELPPLRGDMDITDTARRVGFNEAVRELNTKAQQFIDRLEKQ